jgi:hypothetical protein
MTLHMSQLAPNADALHGHAPQTDRPPMSARTIKAVG